MPKFEILDPNTYVLTLSGYHITIRKLVPRKRRKPNAKP